MSNLQPSPVLDAILEIARDLASSLRTENRYARLLGAVCRVVPCDAACLMRLDGSRLIPLAARGLSRAALAQTYERTAHPRLDTILGSVEPVRFAPDSDLPDPFDGLVAGVPDALEKVHDCMGCALVDDGEVVGALTLDAFAAGSFDEVDRRLLATLGALAGATLRTSALLEALEARAEHSRRVAVEIGRAPELRWVGKSPALDRLLRDLEIVAPTDLTILIVGETGVGKELIAREVHRRSKRAAEPLVHVNCAALPEALAESELFGHVAGAFTGATRDRPGKFEAAHGGTLFLDEIGELPLSIQAKLLRALQNGEIQRVGSDRPRRADTRVIAATNRDLEHEVELGRFRADLYHRLGAFPLEVPPLRARPEDIPELAEHFAELTRRRLGTGRVTISQAAMKELCAQDWPGNVRELENAVSRAVLRATGATPDASERVNIEPRHLARTESASIVQNASRSTPAKPQSGPLRDRVRAFQRQQVLSALDQNDGSWAGAARSLGLHRSNLHHLARRLGIRR